MGNVRFGSSNTSECFQQNIEIPFFNYYLKGKGSDAGIAEANIFITGENQWNKLDQWPPKISNEQILICKAMESFDGSQ